MSDVTAAIAKIEQAQLRKTPLPKFRVGDTVRVWVLIKEADKERPQAYEGVVIKRHNASVRATFTVRKISYGVGVERVFPVHSPRIEKVEVLSRGVVRHARLYYLRNLKGKAARIRERQGSRNEVAQAEKAAAAAAAEKAKAAAAEKAKAAAAAEKTG